MKRYGLSLAVGVFTAAALLVLSGLAFGEIAGPATIPAGEAATYTESRATTTNYGWTVNPDGSLKPNGAAVTFTPANPGSYSLKCEGTATQRYGLFGRRTRTVPWADSLGVTVKGDVPPPPPPPPQVGLRILITGPGPRAVRDMSPEGVAVLTSRTVRDWTDKACEPGGFLIAPLAVVKSDPRFAPLVEKVPSDHVTLAAKMPDKDVLLLDPVPAYNIVLEKLSEYAGVKAAPNAARPPPALREFTEAEWTKYTNAAKVVDFGGEKRFLSAMPRDLRRNPYGASLADAGVRVIPRAEWPARLAALKAANAGIRALLWDKLPCSDQDGTNYCWANGPANCGSTIIYVTGRGSYLLSAASIGGPVTGYRNQGGWPKDAVDFMASNGAVRDSLWPNAAINRSYYNQAAVQADYPNHLVSSTIADLGQTNRIFDETVTCVLLGCPVATSHNWWSHAVMATGLDYSDGVWFLEERNSWGMSYGEQGFFKLREGAGRNQAGPDDGQTILWLGAKAPVGSDGASTKPLFQIPLQIQVPAAADVCPSGDCQTCPNGRGRRR